MVVDPISAVAGLALGMLVGLGTGALLGPRFLSGPDEQTADPSAVAQRLETEPTEASVRNTLESLVDAVDRLDQAAPGRSAAANGPAERAQALADAVEDGDLVFDRPVEDESDPVAGADPKLGADIDSDLEPDQAEQGPSFDHVVAAARAVQEGNRIQSRDLSRLLEYLTDPDRADEAHIRDTLSTVVGTVEEADQLDEALSVVTDQGDPAQMGDRVARELSGVDGDRAAAVRRLAKSLSDVATRLDRCERTRSSVEEALGRVGTVVDAQVASLDLSAGSPSDQAQRLASALDNGDVTLTDTGSGPASAAAAAERDVDPESPLASDLVEALSDTTMTNDETLRKTLKEVLRAIDETETVRGRLDTVDRDTVRSLADDLAEDLSASASSVESHLADRVNELREMIDRASEADTLPVYAAKQELTYYDRTLFPRLRRDDGGEDTDTETVEQLLEEVEQRRSHIRTSYPSNYPDHNHTIPIHFLELVAHLHEEATHAVDRDEHERALGLLDAADDTLDWIDDLYDRHDYRALLQQLRG